MLGTSLFNRRKPVRSLTENPQDNISSGSISAAQDLTGLVQSIFKLFWENLFNFGENLSGLFREFLAFYSVENNVGNAKGRLFHSEQFFASQDLTG